MAIIRSINADNGSPGVERKQSAVKHILNKVCKIPMKNNFFLKNVVRF